MSIRYNKFLCNLIFFLVTAPGLFFITYFCLHAWGFTVDDAFIEFRYAENFVETGKILWNIGAAPTEGCTSIAHLMLLSSLHFFGATPLAASRIISVGSLIIIYYIALVYAQHDWKTAMLWGLLFNFFTINFGTSIHTLSGLETIFYTSLVFMLCISYADALQKPSRFITFSLLGLACGLARPESNAFVFLLLCITPFFLATMKQKKNFILSGLIFYALPAIIYFIWRKWYFQLLFPLPFYTKVEGGRGEGLQAVVSFISSTYPFFISALCIYILSYKKNKCAILGFLSILTIMLIFVVNVKQIMAFEHRYLYPAVAVLLASGFFIAQQKETTKNLLLVIFCCCITLYCFLQNHAAHNNMNYFIGYAASEKNIYGKLGRKLSDLDPKYNFLVMSDAGITPYYSKLHTIDYWSLTDREIASKHLNGPQTASYIFSHSTPTVIILLSHSEKDNKHFALEKDISIYEMAVGKNYCVLDTLQNLDKDYLWLMIPKKRITDLKSLNPNRKIEAPNACFPKN